MKRISATYKGLITGVLMILVSLAIYALKGNFENNLQYITYSIYIGGIIWTLKDFKKNVEGEKLFKQYFSEGFKCFIVVTFLMVAFTWIFIKLNPSIKEAMAENFARDLNKTGNYTEAEIAEKLANARQYFITMQTSMAIFGYLVIGVMVTAVTSFILRYQKQQ